MLRTAGQLAPPSNNSSLTGHTHRKLPASPRGHFYPTISQQQQHQPGLLARSRQNLRSNTTGHKGDYFISALKMSISNSCRLKRSINALETLISTCPSLLLTLIQRQAKVTLANILNRKPLKPLQHLVFIGPHVPPPCCTPWLVRP